MNCPQALKDACRWICFFTPVKGHEVATYGGTAIVIIYDGKPYAITARHNAHSFNWGDVIITKDRTSNKNASIRAISYPGRGLGHAEGSDLTDIVFIQFDAEVTVEFFEGAVYDLDRMPVCVSRPDDDLVVYGALSDQSAIDGMNIFTQFAELGFVDIGPHSHDVVLRSAKGQWLNSRVTHLAGLSGAPVYNISQDGLCGMMVRGSLSKGGVATVHYIDIADIARVLNSVNEGQMAGFYRKTVAHPTVS